MENRKKGITLIILSSLFFALMASSVKMVGQLPLALKIFFRNGIGLIFIYTIIRRKGISIVPVNKKMMALRSLFGLMGVALYYYALSQLPLSNAVILNKLSPFFVVVFSVLFLGERINKWQLGGLALALIGAIFVVNPTGDFPIFPSLIALLSAVTAGAAYTTIRKLSATDKPQVIVFYFCLVSSVSSIPFIPLESWGMLTLTDIFYLVLIGVTALIAQLCMTNAYRHAPASELSIYTYLNIVFSTLLGIVLFNEFPSIVAIIGGAFIILAGYINYASKKIIKH